MGIARYLGILIGKAHKCVDNDNAHVGTVNCHISSQYAVMLYFFGYLGLSSDTCGINENVLAAG